MRKLHERAASSWAPVRWGLVAVTVGVIASGCAGSSRGGGAGGDDGGGDDGSGTAGPAIGFASASETIWEGTGMWPVELVASAPVAAAVRVDYQVASSVTGGRVDGLASGSVMIEAGQTTAEIVVPVVDDSAVQPPETVTLTLSMADDAAGGADPGPHTGPINVHTLTLLDNDDRAWPGATAIATADTAAQFGENLSGLSYEPAAGAQPATLWAVKNGPSILYRLARSGAIWAPVTTDGWSAGKTLVYPDGSGSPDAEGVARAELTSTAIYVATERDNDVDKTSRLSVLRYDTAGAGTTLTATHEWNLTADLPAVDPNLGLEAITWVPDSALVAQGFYDDHLARPYDPAQYPDHGTGVFLVGLEANGMVYAYALDHVHGGFQRLAAFPSNHAQVMGLDYDRDAGYLWTACDDNCNGDLAVLAVETNPRSAHHGHFVLRRAVDRPSGMPNLNNEDLAIAPDSECTGGQKPVIWTDDSATDGHSLRTGSVPCGPAL
jgi:hypothetical protein